MNSSCTAISPNASTMKTVTYEICDPSLFNQAASSINPINTKHQLHFSAALIKSDQSDYFTQHQTQPRMGSFVSLIYHNNHIKVVNETNTCLGYLPEKFLYIKDYLDLKIEFVGMITYQNNNDLMVDIMPL